MGFKKLYTIENIRPLPCLGNIVGPIRTPVRLEEKDVIDLVKNNFSVYEHNPLKKKEKVKVTLNNYSSITFKTSKKEAIDEKALKKELIKETTTPPEKKEKEKKKEKETKNDATTETPIQTDFSK